MVNEQIQTILNKLGKLTGENPNLVVDGLNIEQFISGCKNNEAPISVIVSCLLDTIKEKDEEIKSKNQTITNYQAQTQGLNSQLSRNKPRRLSLQGGEVSFTSLSPHSGLPSPFRTPATPTIPELNNLSNLVYQRETELEQEASQVIANLRASEEKLLQQVNSLSKQLEQKEALLTSLENESYEQTQQLTQLTGLKTENTKLRTELKAKEEQFKQVEKEMDQTNTDFLLVAERVEVLQTEIKAINYEKIELQHYLNEVSGERDYLKKNQTRTREELLDKIDELAQLKMSAAEQKEKLEEIMLQRELAYKRILQKREAECKKWLDNLRQFQINESNEINKNKPVKKFFSHKHSISASASAPNSGRSTPSSEEGYTFLPPPPSPKSWLSSELRQQGYGEQSGNISPTAESDPLTQAVKRQSSQNKRNSALSYEILTNQGENEEPTESEKDKPESPFNALMSTFDNFQAEPICNIEEHGTLLEEKKLWDSSTQELNAQLLDWKESKSKAWKEELGQAKYELKELAAREQRIVRELTTAQNQISELEKQLAQENNQWKAKQESWQTDLELVTNERDSQRLAFSILATNVESLERTNQQLKSEDETLLEMLLEAVEKADQLGRGIEQTQALIEVKTLKIKN